MRRSNRENVIANKPGSFLKGVPLFRIGAYCWSIIIYSRGLIKSHGEWVYKPRGKNHLVYTQKLQSSETSKTKSRMKSGKT